MNDGVTLNGRGPDHKSDPPPSGHPLMGRVLDGRYRIDGVLGAGAIGVVFSAEDLSEGGRVALKVLSDEWYVGSLAKSRFEREGRALKKLEHPNIVRIASYGVDGEIPYIAMEVLEGESLKAFMAMGRPLKPELAFSIARQILSALAYAHGKQIIHRDLKPANVFLEPIGESGYNVKLLDFGLAKFTAPDEESSEAGEVAQTLTKTGVVVGTPLYMSPEQAVGDKVDVQADVYAAGVLLYEMLTGKPPFKTESHQELVKAHLLAPVPSVADSLGATAADPALDEIIEKAMAKQARDRFQDAGEMLAALEKAVSSTRSRTFKRIVKRIKSAKKRSKLLWTGVAATFVVVALAVGLSGSMKKDPIEKPMLDPWTNNEIPEDLKPIFEKVTQGKSTDKVEEKLLLAYARENPRDPRADLLLARGYANKMWRRDAIKRYVRAFKIEPGSRGDPSMLKNLLDFTESDKYGDEASAAIEEIFGAEALDEVEKALKKAKPDSDHATRLEDLKKKLGSM